MAALSSLALIGGLALSGIGVAAQTFGAVKAAEAQEKGVEAQQKAENARENAMKLDAQRKRREMVRQGILARSQALSQGAAQGAQFGSGLAGAEAGITEQTQFNILGVNESEQSGSYIFAANREGLRAKKQEAQAGTIGAIGGGLGTLGGALMKNVGGINRLGGAFGANYITGV